MKTLRVGSRDSKLAVMQTQIIIDEIQKQYPDLKIELTTLKTTGDLILDKTLDKIGGKGLFVKELDKALMDGKIDIAVHSLKDLPMEENEELPLVALYKRGDPRDALVLPNNELNMDTYSKIGSSSRRRQVQLKALFENSHCESVRGNIVTRLAKLDSGEYSSLILASAGLIRANLDDRISHYFSPEEIVPSAGQGILAIQGRKDFDKSFLACVNDPKSVYAAEAERGFVRFLDGGCSSPIAAYATVEGDTVNLRGLYFSEEKQTFKVDTASGDVKNAREIGENLAKRLKMEVDG